MIKGFVTGGFRPMHLGHEALIEYAKKHCDELIVLVADPPNSEIPYKYRLKWVLSTYLDDPQIEVFGDIVKEPIHKNPTQKSLWWAKYIKMRFGKIDRVFSSENYGVVFAETMGAEHWLCDFERTEIPVSGTMIREKPLTNWEYINNFAKDYFVQKIAIVGTESTGKTVLTKQLAEYYNTTWCPELGRELIPDTNKCILKDLKNVGIEHAKHILKYTRLSNKLLFVDTDLTITKSYAKFLFNIEINFEPWVEKANECNLYIYLDSNAPYVQDGTRMATGGRILLDNSHLKLFSQNGIELKQFKFTTYNDRFNEIIKCIDQFINKL